MWNFVQFLLCTGGAVAAIAHEPMWFVVSVALNIVLTYTQRTLLPEGIPSAVLVFGAGGVFSLSLMGATIPVWVWYAGIVICGSLAVANLLQSPVGILVLQLQSKYIQTRVVSHNAALTQDAKRLAFKAKQLGMGGGGEEGGDE